MQHAGFDRIRANVIQTGMDLLLDEIGIDANHPLNPLRVLGG